jgi:hypothetical protein
VSWLDTSNTQIHDISLSWLDTSNTQIHDISLSLLGTDTHNTQIHDISLSWLVQITMSCICVLGVSVPSRDSEMSCISVLGDQVKTVRLQIPLTHKYMTFHCPDLKPLTHKYMTYHCPDLVQISLTQIHDISLSWLDPSQDSERSCFCVLGYLFQVWTVRCHVFVHYGYQLRTVKCHDISLSWLGTDIPNTQIHDISLSWLGTDIPNTNTWHLTVLTWYP